jgi:predicted aspartyl protease
MGRCRLTSTVALCLLALASAKVVGADAQERFGHSAEMRRFESGNYYVHGVFGADVETDLLVDTGSGYVALTRATFARVKDLPGVTYLRDIAGSMANGKVLQVPVYRVASLKLGETCVLTDIEVAVMASGTRDILGLSALRKVEPFALQLEPPMLYLSSCVADAVAL